MAKYQLVMDQTDKVLGIIVERVKLESDNSEKLKEIAAKNLESVENKKYWTWYIEIFNEEKDKWELLFEESRRSKEQALNLEVDMDYYYTPRDVSRLLRLNESTIKKKIETGEIVAEKIGKSYRLSQREMNKLVQEIGISRRFFEDYIGMTPTEIKTKEEVIQRLNHYIQLCTLAPTEVDLKSVLIKLEKEIEMMIDEI